MSYLVDDNGVIREMTPEEIKMTKQKAPQLERQPRQEERLEALEGAMLAILGGNI